MKLAISSNCTIDSIVIGDSTYTQAGGPVCYGGLTARNLKFDVELFTNYGSDFPHANLLRDKKIKFPESPSKNLTTNFRIEIYGSDRNLSLQNNCEKIEYTKTDADGFVISPVFDEISNETYEKIKKDSKFLLLDPQGFLRRIDSNKKIFLEKTDMNLSKISAIKVNPREMQSLSQSSGIEAMKFLKDKGIKYVLLTDKQNISMLEGERVYSLSLPNIMTNDTTGVGDIFCAAFSCTILKEKDSLWALCFAAGAAQAALETKAVGLDKVPKKNAIETNASYFYNLIKFKEV